MNLVGEKKIFKGKFCPKFLRLVYFALLRMVYVNLKLATVRYQTASIICFLLITSKNKA